VRSLCVWNRSQTSSEKKDCDPQEILDFYGVLATEKGKIVI